MGTLPRRILVATDFSATAELARQAARRVATWFSAELHVLHVRVLLEEPQLDDEHQSELQGLLAKGDEQTARALDHEEDRGAEVTVHNHLVRGISAAEAIVETCAELDCDLIVVGTHGRRGISHLLLGSVAEAVVRTAPVPVLTIGPDTAVNVTTVRRILIPHDFSEHSTRAIETASDWARALAAEITLLHVVEPVVYPEFYAVDLLPEHVVERLQERSRNALQALADKELAGLSVATQVAGGRAVENIVAVAQPDSFDLVIMATRGLSALEHLLLGSVAEGVLRRCALPLLTVRAD